MMAKQILVVDDSLMMRKAITKLFEESGYTVVAQAKNGNEALVLYKLYQPDLVTMDLTMKEMDGFEAASLIIAYDAQAKILFLSNLDKDKYETEVKRLGGIGFVSKHSTNEILDIIQNN
ncbi:response regulator [Candidatus Venteria ishoeyi]|uniref:Chemotaxis protein CheY n=1 Tax=Candidatus Venteria ishoeyi TaxID=1899563 RepID=A0A1H6F836_9GAMM|nr:response regulator [Candidatus Venteria ishoeyi]MDM8547961.1 response regulator [Candidatus Venteria ishoeyi]SEH05125.1 Chemotaxis protein CheY [Candidatus Venteria ishoeyi]